MKGHLAGTLASELSHRKKCYTEDNRTACFGFYKNKNNIVPICLHWKWGDGITEMCVVIKQIDAASGSICKTDNTDF